MVTRRELREISQRAAAAERGRRNWLRTLHGRAMAAGLVLAGLVFWAGPGLTNLVGSADLLWVVVTIVAVVVGLAVIGGLWLKRYMDGY